MQTDWFASASAILFREWDPIGISRWDDSPRDEYDDYRNHLAGLIRAGASDHVLLDNLEWAEVECIELGPIDYHRNTRVVAALRALGPPPG